MKLFKTEEHAAIATPLSNMAVIYTVLGQKDKALAIFNRVLGTNFKFYLLLLLK